MRDLLVRMINRGKCEVWGVRTLEDDVSYRCGGKNLANTMMDCKRLAELLDS